MLVLAMYFVMSRFTLERRLRPGSRRFFFRRKNVPMVRPNIGRQHGKGGRKGKRELRSPSGVRVCRMRLSSSASTGRGMHALYFTPSLERGLRGGLLMTRQCYAARPAIQILGHSLYKPFPLTLRTYISIMTWNLLRS
jgi:hypothetical protein